MTNFKKSETVLKQNEFAPEHVMPSSEITNCDSSVLLGADTTLEAAKSETGANGGRLVWAGNSLLDRVASIRKVGKGLGNRKQIVTLRNGDVYTIAQLDRDYFEVNGPHLTNCRVDGWNDGARLINGI